MQAAVLKAFGDADELRLGEFPDPRERAGWVTVRLRTAAVNWHDVLVRQGRYGSPLPHVPGADGAGVRSDTGEEVVVLPTLAWGSNDRVPARGWNILGDVEPGTYAELVGVPEECVFPKPSGWSWADAAALPLVGVTAYRALFERARLAPGEALLVTGAGGGLSPMAVVLAVAAGIRVAVTSSSVDKIEQARSIGASGGVVYTDDDWPARAREVSPDGDGFDVVLDSVGDWRRSLAALRPGGRLVVLGASHAEEATLDVRPFYFGQYDVLGTTMGSARDFGQLLRFLAERDVRPPVVDRILPLERAAAAHVLLERGEVFGKVVLEP